jgi:hypothetical protein
MVSVLPQSTRPTQAAGVCRVIVRDKETAWPVPLVELRTTNQVRFVSDNAGVIALTLPDRMHRETWFHVVGHGYQVPADGFGMRGVRLTPRPNETLTVEVERTAIARRIGRLTGGGLFAESQQLGEFQDWQESPLVGCDSVQLVIFGDRAFWNWGDTSVARYPLGNFHMTGATSGLDLFSSCEPPLRPTFDYFLNDKGSPRPMAPIDGPGPTWLTGFAVLPDMEGQDHLVACYRKIRPPLTTYEIGLCEWHEQQREFVATARLWHEASNSAPPSHVAEGHSVAWSDAQGQQWRLFGNPLPQLRCRNHYEAWRDTATWEPLQPQTEIPSADGKSAVTPHSGSIGWNAFRQRWVTVFVQKFGSPSAFGEVWYAEADSPLGPWGPAVKVLSHENYTFYNPRLHAELSPAGSAILLFEGTYSQEFANHPAPTPRYDYNQILYRLDLDDARLESARQ